MSFATKPDGNAFGNLFFSQPDFADERNYYKGSAGFHAQAESTQARNWSAGLAVYDISKPDDPRQIGFMPVDGGGLHRAWLNGLTEVLRKQNAVEWVLVRHEEVAAFAAGAEAHLTGSLTVCPGSCRPGNMHLINGLYSAPCARGCPRDDCAR